MNMQKMMKQMQKMQKDLAKTQAELELQEYEAEAGGGMVTVKINGAGKLTGLSLNPEVVDPDDVEAIEDLVLVAVNAALDKKEEAAQGAMGGLTQGMGGMGILGF
jgi:nucleoid-associated protein EbfC